MALLSTCKAHAVCGAVLLCWASSTYLSSPVFAETLNYRPQTHNELGQSSVANQNPYLARRQQLQEAIQEKTELPSPDLLRPYTIVDAQLVPQKPKTEPMKITIPNLKALEEKGGGQMVLNYDSNAALNTAAPQSIASAAITKVANSFLPDDAPRQTVAEFKPITPRSAEEFAELAPAAGTETTIATPAIPAAPSAPIPAIAPAASSANAPLIAAPEEVHTPSAIAAAAPAAVPTPTITAPVIANDYSQAIATQALDSALIATSSSSDTYSEAPAQLPSLAPKSALSKNKKPAKKEAQKKESAEEKPYSALDTEPTQQLSSASKAILKKIPSNIDRPKQYSGEAVDIERIKEGLENISEPEQKIAVHESNKHQEMGIKIDVKNRVADLDYDLGKAYYALVSGQPTLAMEIYKNVLTNDPNNKGALFGLATTYHRSGLIDQARIYYRKLLAIDPKNRDGLNNFLVLLADEAPEEALTQMQQLSERNPNFSPISAQMAIINQKLGRGDEAIRLMYKAVELAPENLVYRYNLAIMLDKQKKYEEAGRIYKQLVDASMRGEVVPGNLQKIQQRLTFISSNRR